MKKNFGYALLFTVEWVLYCLVIMVQSTSARGFTGIMGTLLGAVFMWGCGVLLLHFTGRHKQRLRSLVIGTVLLLLADLGAKAMVAAWVPRQGGVQLIPGWLSIQYAPNYSNNVILNLLNVQLATPAFHAVSKGVIVLLAGVMVWYYLRSEPYLKQSPQMRFGIMLLAAGALSSTIESGARGFILDFIAYAGLVAFDFKDLYLMFGIGLLIYAFWQQSRTTAKAPAKSA